MTNDPTLEIPQPVEAIAVRPGDTLLLRMPERASLKEIDEMSALLRQHLDGINVVIIDGHEIEHVAVYRPTAETP